MRLNEMKPIRLSLLFLLSIYAGTTPECPAHPANAWHIPDNNTDLSTNMRSPEFELGTNTTLTVYQGVQKWSGGGVTQIMNQTGGLLYFRGAPQGMNQSNEGE